MKLWALPCRATQDGQVMVESSEKTWSTGKGMANHFSILALRTPWTVWKGKKIRTLKDPTRSVGAQYATGDQWRNNFRKNEGMESKQKQHQVVDVTGDRSRVWCCKELRARIGHSTHHLPTTQETTLHMGITRWPIPKSDWLFSFAAKDEEGLYSKQKQDWELTVVKITNSLLPNSGTQGRVLKIYISNKYLGGADILCLGATI